MHKLLKLACCECSEAFRLRDKKFNRRRRRVHHPRSNKLIFHRSCVDLYNVKHPVRTLKKKKASGARAVKSIKRKITLQAHPR